MMFRDTPQTEGLPLSTAAEAFIVAAWVMHQAQAMMLVARVIAADSRLSMVHHLHEFEASWGYLQASFEALSRFPINPSLDLYIFFRGLGLDGLDLLPRGYLKGLEGHTLSLEELPHELVV
jgi:hypothetical protein